MRNRCLLFALALIGVFVAAGLAQRDNASQSAGSAKWEYGILRMDNLTWQERTRVVDQRNGADFAAALGASYSPTSNVYEINLLSALGDQGWDLVAVPRSGFYVFKRPK